MQTDTRRTLFVSGASGQLGRRVVELLLEGPDRVIAGTRTPEKLSDLKARGADVRRMDFDAPDTFSAALRGADRALLVSTDALDRPGRRLEQHRAALRAFAQASVQHVVYTSLTHPDPDSFVTLAPDHWQTERALAEAGFGYTILRNNLYTDLLLAPLAAAAKSGQLVNACGDGAIAYVTREDCARAAAAALTSSFAGRAVLEITGPAGVTQAELARIAGNLARRPLEYIPVDAAASRARLLAAGVPAPVSGLLVSFEQAAAAGQLGATSGAVRELTGTAPSAVSGFLARHAQAFR